MNGQVAQPGRMDDPELRGRLSFLWSLTKPVITAVHGAAAGIGFVLTCYADLRFAATGTKLTAVTSRLGLPAEMGLSWVLPRLIGVSPAADLLLSGRIITAEEAARIGLVHRLLPPETLLDEALRAASELARSAAPSSLKAVKEQLYTDLRSSLYAAETRDEDLLGAMIGTPDFREGVNALLQGRPPDYLSLADSG